MSKPNVLIIADQRDIKFLNINKKSEYWNIFWKIINYDKLNSNKCIDELKYIIQEYDIDFVLYSRNDQIANKIRIGPITKKLKTGYSSFSGIDTNHRISEMKKCFDDFMECDNNFRLDLPSLKKRNFYFENKGSFSLVFDTEQIGCIRYGLPRILRLLNEFEVKATFFVTNLMKKIYPNIVDNLSAEGHEIGLHGRWHEHLSRYNKDEQIILIEDMKKDFRVDIYSANFIGRSNEDTIHALIKNEIKYFYFPAINYYRFFCYPKISTAPFSISTKGDGSIWMIPISVETYGLPWFSTKNMIDSAYNESLKSNRHITILCHPFRDGNLQHIESTKKMIKYLIIDKKLKPVIVKDLALCGEEYVDPNKIHNLVPRMELKDLLPKTRHDYIGIIPENFIMLNKIIMKKYTLW